MRTIRTKLYQFSELSTAAKQKVIKWYSEKILPQDIDILFGFEEYCQGEAAEAGFVNAEINYSLSYCQGDGLSLSADIDKASFIKVAIPGIKESVLKVLIDKTAVSIKANRGHYSFAHHSQVEFCLEASGDYPNIEALCEIVREDIVTDYMSLCKKLEDAGYNWIEQKYLEENIIEDIEANNYEFLKDGTYYRY